MAENGLDAVLADDALSEAEQKYFDTAGDTSGLLSDHASRSSQPVSTQVSATRPTPEPSQEERHRAELEQERERRVRTEERLALLSEVLSPQQQAEERQAVRADPRPDPERDVFAYMAWQERRAERLEQALANTQNAVIQQRDHYNGERAAQQFIGTYRQDAANFAQQNPDFGEAYRYILADRDRELQMMGYADANQRAQIITAEERDLVTRNLQARKSPAQAIYNLAKGRGFKGGSRGSGGDAGRLSVAQIANLPDDQFQVLTARLGGLDNILKKIG